MSQELRTITDVMESNEKRLGTINEATAELNRVMAAARATGKKGTVTLKFEVAPDKNDELALTILCDVSSTVPKPDRRKALVYHNSETQTFSRTDPRQMELLAEKEQERNERNAELEAAGVARLDQVGRGPIVKSN